MATFDKTNAATGYSWNGLNKAIVLKNKVDLTGVTTVNTDVIQSLDIPANTFVMAVAVKIITPKGGVVTATVGDGAGASSWDASTNLNAAAGTWTSSDGTAAADAYAIPNGKLYTVADTIDLTVSADAAGAVYEVYAFCLDLN